MKITITDGPNRAEAEDDGSTSDDLMELFVRAALGIGYHPDNVNDSIINKAWEIDDALLKKGKADGNG